MLSFNKSMFNKTGGFFYHIKAIRYKKKYWQNFTKNINDWAKNWPQKNNSLLIIGPSGGYTLSCDFLNRYKEITCVDIDKSASFFFKLSHKNKNYIIDWDQTNYFENLDLLYNKIKNKNYDILFSNILGQIPMMAKNWEANENKFIQKLTNTLKGQNWASYHDVYSSKSKPNIKNHTGSLDATRIYNSIPKNSFVVDHLSKNIFANSKKKDYFTWQIKPNYYHLIEATYEN